MELTAFTAMTTAESVCYTRTGTARGDILSFVMPFDAKGVSETRTELRVYLDGAGFRVCAADLMHLAGFSNKVGATWLLRRHVQPEGRRLCIVADKTGRQRRMWQLNTYGVMALLSGIGTPFAKALGRYLREVVFRAVRMEIARDTGSRP